VGVWKSKRLSSHSTGISYVGVNENSKVVEWSLYPNPTSEVLNIKGLDKGVKLSRLLI